MVNLQLPATTCVCLVSCEHSSHADRLIIVQYMVNTGMLHYFIQVCQVFNMVLAQCPNHMMSFFQRMHYGYYVVDMSVPIFVKRWCWSGERKWEKIYLYDIFDCLLCLWLLNLICNFFFLCWQKFSKYGPQN